MKFINLFSRFINKKNKIILNENNINLIKFNGKPRNTIKIAASSVICFAAIYTYYKYLKKHKPVSSKSVEFKSYLSLDHLQLLPILNAKEKNKSKVEQESGAADDGEQIEVIMLYPFYLSSSSICIYNCLQEVLSGNNSRKRTFFQYASVEYNGVAYMTPQDLIDSITFDRPRRKNLEFET